MTALEQSPFLNRNLLSIELWHSHNTLNFTPCGFYFYLILQMNNWPRVNVDAGSNVWLLKNRTGKCIQGLFSIAGSDLRLLSRHVTIL
jgi:hypothetical protein